MARIGDTAVTSLKNVLEALLLASDEPLTLADLGITDLESIEAIAPTYLWRFRPHGEFSTAS